MSNIRSPEQGTVDSAKRIWDDLGGIDPLWVILTKSENRWGKWDHDEFFQTGRAEIALLMDRASALGLPEHRRLALDFGCGVGRLTQALSAEFQEAIGVDISESMVEGATRLNQDRGGRCLFKVNATSDLRQFETDSFDLIYSRLVLQHVPDQALIKRYLQEFVRVLASGGLLAFQLPERIPLRQRIQSHRRLYPILRAFGFTPNYLLRKLQLQPMASTGISEAEVRATLRAAGGEVLAADPDESNGSISGRFYYVTKE